MRQRSELQSACIEADQACFVPVNVDGPTDERVILQADMKLSFF
jgi:hypothetical protein